MDALVTGGTGFVGANVVRELLARRRHGTRARAPGGDRRALAGLAVEIVEGDLLDRGLARAGRARRRDGVHVAADYRLWARDPRVVFRTNVGGTRAVLEAAAERGRPSHRATRRRSARWASPRRHAGHGGHAGHRWPTWSARTSASKFLAEQVARDLARPGAPVVVVNPSAPVGPWDVKPTPTGQMIVDFMRGRMFATLDTGLNVVHVRDVARGHLLAARMGRVGERYILGHANLSLREIFAAAGHDHRPPAAALTLPYAVAWRGAACMEGGRAADGPRHRGARSPPSAWRASACTSSPAKAVRELGLPQTDVREALATRSSGSAARLRAARTRSGASGHRMNAHGSRRPLTRRSRSNFYYAFLALPRPRRHALYAVYAFCRTVDDIADLGQERGAEPPLCAPSWTRGARTSRAATRPTAGPSTRSPSAWPLAVRTYPIPQEALTAIVDGRGDGSGGRRPTRRSTTSIRTATGSRPPSGSPPSRSSATPIPRARLYATNLGIALQLTNIIRDVGSDARAGRVYLPREDLRKFGVTPDDLSAGRYTAGFVLLMEHQAARRATLLPRGGDAFPRRDAAR